MNLPEMQVLVRIPLKIPGLAPNGIPIFWYGVMLLCGFVAAMLLARRLARREGLPPAAIYDLAVWALVSGLLGARLWYVAEFTQRIFYDEDGEFVGLPRGIGRALNVTDGGLVFYGGIIAAILVLAWYFRRHRLPALKMFDILAPAAMLGLAFGRIGCTFNGCCFGKVCAEDFPLAIRRPTGGSTWKFHREYYGLPAEAPWSLPVVPAQLMGSATALLIAALLVVAYRRKKRDGDILARMLLVYPAARFLLEMIREHETSEVVGLISISQAVSVVGFLIGVTLIVLRRRRPLAVPYVSPEPPLAAIEKAETPKTAAATPHRKPPPRRRRR